MFVATPGKSIRVKTFLHPVIGGSATCFSCRHIQRKVQRDLKHNWDSQFLKDCRTLEVPYDCDEGRVKSAYLRLAKKYHPDGGDPAACPEKFHQVDTAYRNLLNQLSLERLNEPAPNNRLTDQSNLADSEKEEELKHVAPQHRQYLSFEGVGAGTPAQREKQYQKHRAMKASSNVWQHRIQQAIKDNVSEETKVVTVKDKRAAKDIRTRFGMDRLVEDLIQESMAKGDFDNLKGQGKPLEHDKSYNPYIDFTTHKLNQVLIENGFTPEWILLEKEIRQEIRYIRQKLKNFRHLFDEKMTAAEEVKWKKFVDELVPECKALNSKIQKYNLVVPSIFKQIICLQLEREANIARQHFSHDLKKSAASATPSVRVHMKKTSTPMDTREESFLDMLLSIIKSK